MSFFLARPTSGTRKSTQPALDAEFGGWVPPPVCPNLIPPEPDKTLSRLAEMRKLFDKENIFRNPAATTPVPVRLTARFISISQIDTGKEQFRWDVCVW